jgi:hypothetical protein
VELIRRGEPDFHEKSFMRTVRRKFTNTPPTKNQKMYPSEVRRGANRAEARRKRKFEMHGSVPARGGRKVIARKKGKRSGEYPPDGERKTAE